MWISCFKVACFKLGKWKAKWEQIYEILWMRVELRSHANGHLSSQVTGPPSHYTICHCYLAKGFFQIQNLITNLFWLSLSSLQDEQYWWFWVWWGFLGFCSRLFCGVCLGFSLLWFFVFFSPSQIAWDYFVSLFMVLMLELHCITVFIIFTILCVWRDFSHTLLASWLLYRILTHKS